MKKTKGDKTYKRSLQTHEWTTDKMPDKKVEGRKFKRKERQRGKKETVVKQCYFCGSIAEDHECQEYPF